MKLIDLSPYFLPSLVTQMHEDSNLTLGEHYLYFRGPGYFLIRSVYPDPGSCIDFIWIGNIVQTLKPADGSAITGGDT